MSTHTGYIYCITCLIDGKRYIGQTTFEIGKRMTEHYANARNGVSTSLYDAMRKYGHECFLPSCLQKIEACSLSELKLELNNAERHYISLLNTREPSGYNMTDGGLDFAVPSSRSVSLVSSDGDILDSFNSIREASMATGVSEKSIQHACGTKYHFSAGKFWYYSDDISSCGANIGQQRRGKNNWKGHVTYPGKSIYKLSKSGQVLAQYASSAEAARLTGISQGDISNCCNGTRKSAGGYRWAFVNDKEVDFTCME